MTILYIVHWLQFFKLASEMTYFYNHIEPWVYAFVNFYTNSYDTQIWSYLL
jgi:hypothetical protein